MSAPKPRAHFLHVGKTGGTALTAALTNVLDAGAYGIAIHPHRVRLRDIPRGEKVFFFLRDPVDRFVSGFYSRQRKGRPRYFREWTPQERWAFAIYDSPEALASDLGGGLAARYRARRAMRAIQHVRDRYASWLGGLRDLESRLDDLLYVGFLETFERDFLELLERLGLPPTLRLPEDDVQSHRTPDGLNRALSARAVDNLVRYYRDDFACVAFCRNWRRRRDDEGRIAQTVLESCAD